MTRRTIATVAALGILAAGCGGTTADPNAPPSVDAATSEAEATELLKNGGTVAGVARDASSGASVAGVVVTIGTRSATTAADGTYAFQVLAGSYTATAARTGYVTATQPVVVKRRTTSTLDWSLAPVVVACSYVYGEWGACQPDGTQARTLQSSSPAGCTGTPELTRACTYVPPTQPPAGSAYKVFANNDLGMHCVDKSFAVFSILPPYNVVDAQVVALQASGKPVLLDQTKVDVRYSAIADGTGSINSTSLGKSDFWTYALALYGASLAPGQGLEGMWMPADAPSPAGTTLAWDAGMGLFRAPGIPIFPVDDRGNVNRYPLLRFSAFDKAGTRLGSTDVVLPVSEETSCQNCHATGKVAAPAGTQAWSTDPDLEAQSRRNVLILHNARKGTNLQAPVLCAGCHYSPALDLAGTGPSPAQAGHRNMSSVMHAFHADKMTGLSDAPVPVGGTVPAAAIQSCYQCHPGASTQCLRGAMTTSVDCQNCHGNMAAVGGAYPLLAGGSIDGANDGGARRPWLDVPRCQSCHAGDAVSRTTVANAPPLAADGLRFNEAFRKGDSSASPLLAANPRFAEQAGKLYRKSKGHGGLACEACHGSTHAIWSGNVNDDVAATQLQGHAGTIGECSACHLAAPTPGLGGPHGMHPVGAAWVEAHHEDQFTTNLAACQACHGVDYRGTVLSRMFATRTLAGRTLSKGAMVGCYDCHGGPRG
jgi:hypothetical protein